MVAKKGTMPFFGSCCVYMTFQEVILGLMLGFRKGQICIFMQMKPSYRIMYGSKALCKM
ncbi:hypothetical protein D3C76_1828520 [compost metagenome]